MRRRCWQQPIIVPAWLAWRRLRRVASVSRKGLQMTAMTKMRSAGDAFWASLRVFLSDIGAGALEVSHNSLALLGLCTLAVALFATGRDDLRMAIEEQALDWLQARQEAREPARIDADLAEPSAVARATAADPKELPRPQAAVAQWLARRYKVAPEPLSALVQEAWQMGQRMGVEPTLILAVMAVESSFNPFAQSAVGAQGLMQVMTRVHDDKYEAFGGRHAAFDPVANLRVGVQVLKECITRAGGLDGGLRAYLGATSGAEDGGYVARVLAEQLNLRRVADGKPVAVNASLNPAAPPAAPVRLAPPAAERVALLH
jgi:soluble lytic murein transglycosylase-like protein